jgi:hypothetical protein
MAGLELYVFGNSEMARRAGFREGAHGWRHPAMVEMRAFILGRDWPAEARGHLWSRVTITESADYQAHHFQAQGQALHDLRAMIKPMLRDPPMLWIEL